MRFLIFSILPALSPFSLAHAAVSFSGHINATPTTASLRGNRHDDASDSHGAIGNVATDSASMSATTNDEVMAYQNERILQQLMPPSFVPLGCNKDPCANGEMTWTDFNPRVGQLVIIPCGVCITMDYDKNDMNGDTTNGFYLKLPKGLEIQGSLIFRDTNQYRLTIETPSVVVQGNLAMSAVSSRVTGQPLIRFILTGSNRVTFTPIGANTMACPVENSMGELVAGVCDIGIKPFVVAGGRIDVRGLPATCKTWVKLKDINGLQSTLLVPADGVSSCWSKGAEILITSHTTRMEDAQVRRLVKSPYSMDGDNGLVRLDLDDSIVPPVTARQDDGFEVEVALLSRNIVLEGATDETDSLMGGHFMVMNTPKVVQVIEGIEYNNFGRQGELGRYPIHLHMCQSSPSLISKNLIRNSNQRCVVIHGTHNATVFGNVAFNTAGHCFITEDGGEIDNSFQANLGATTKAVVRLIRKDDTDAANPTTFWCSNPMNEWVGNVAAGSKGFGFWFELEETVRPPTLFLPSSKDMNPRNLPLQKFVNNVAHSNNRHGLRTYPNGMFPSKTAIVENYRAYKNQGGFFLRHTGNFFFEGGVLADNRWGCDMSFVQNITLDGTKVIGLSDRFREIIETQDASYAYDRIVGIELHSLAQAGATIGATIRNVQFSGFDDTNSESNALIQIDPELTEPGFENFDSWSRLEGITVPNGMDPFHFDFNDAVDMGIAGLYLIDIDSSMNPSGGSIQGASTVIADTADMKAFVDMRRCDSFPQYAYLYCKQTCLRTITFAIDSAETDGVLLRMTDLNDSTRSFVYRGGHNPFDETEFAKTDISKHRIFAAVLPPGSYQAEFVRTAAGVAIWPSFVQTSLKRAFCGNALAVDAVEVMQKAPSTAQCESLIRNGNMENSNTDYPYWLHSQAGIQIVRGEGLAGTNAIATVDSTSSQAYIGQYIDIRCLKRGAMYDVRAWVRLESSNGNTFSCNTGAGNCPSIRLRMRTPVDNIGSDFLEQSMFVATEFVQPYDDDNGWNLFQGTITVTAPLAAASSVSVTIDRRRANVKMFVDNVSMTSITQNCNQLVFNGAFSQGTSIFWRRSEESSELAILTRQSNHALQLSNRKVATDAIVQSIATGCMIKGDVYLVQAKVRVLNPNGSDFDCNPAATAGNDKACPRMRLKSTINVGLASEAPSMRVIAETEHGTITATNGDVWRTMSGIFPASGFDEQADESVLLIDGVHKQNTIVVDSVSITPLALSCTQLIRNGNAELGPTAQFWEGATNNQNVLIEVIQLGSSSANNHGFYITGREFSNDGPAQSIDPRCMQETATKWTLKAQMKLVSSETGIPTSCDPTDSRISESCPFVLVTGYLNGVLEEQKQYSMTNDDVAWIANDMNEYVVENIKVSEVLAACTKVIISFRLKPTWELLIDNISMKPSS